MNYTPTQIDAIIAGCQNDIQLLTDDALRFTRAHEQAAIAIEIASVQERLKDFAAKKMQLLGL